VPPAWVPAAIVAEGRKARENLRGESSWEFFASGGPYILGINMLFTNQTGGVACLHPKCEGVLLPLTSFRGLNLEKDDPLQDFYESLLAPITEIDRIAWIDRWLSWSKADDLFSARGDEELAEAWIPVRIRPEVGTEGHPLLGAFAGCEAILTYTNSD